LVCEPAFARALLSDGPLGFWFGLGIDTSPCQLDDAHIVWLRFVSFDFVWFVGLVSQRESGAPTFVSAKTLTFLTNLCDAAWVQGCLCEQVAHMHDCAVAHHLHFYENVKMPGAYLPKKPFFCSS